MAGGGPLESVTINNRRFPVDGEANADIMLPGFTSEVKPNGDGSNRKILSRKTGKLDKIPINIDNERGDMEFLQSVMDDPDFVSCLLVEVDGTVWEGDMTITGEPGKSSKEGTMEITLEGSLSRQGA